MKKHTLKLAALAAVLTLAVLPSCKKDDDTKSRSQMLEGTWRNAEEGDDANNNGVWDTNEHAAVATGDMVTFKFNSDGSGTITPDALPVPFPMTWTLQNSESTLRIITDYGVDKDTSFASFVSFTESEAVLKDVSGTPTYFFNLKKQ